MDFTYIGGSMGSVVGEKIARAVDHSIRNKTPLLIISKSGGARMMEGAISLMQMAKTSAKLTQLSKNKLPYISLCTDPTTGGTTASFAMLGDIIISEPGALIGFAGQPCQQIFLGRVAARLGVQELFLCPFAPANTPQGARSELLQDLSVEELAFHTALRSHARNGAIKPA